jgi:hypothetical protein
VISLVGLCLLVMALLHWVLEPLEAVFTWTLQLNLLPWLLGLFFIWLLAGNPTADRRPDPDQAG